MGTHPPPVKCSNHQRRIDLGWVVEQSPEKNRFGMG